MSTVQQEKLRGGLGTERQDSGNGETNGKKSKKTVSPREALARIQKGMPRKEICLKPRGKEVSEEPDDRIPAAELVKYVDEYASDRVFPFIVDIARPFQRATEKEVENLGGEIWDDMCPDGEETFLDRYNAYSESISAVRNYDKDSDQILREQAELPGRDKFIDKLCLRVRQMSELALLYDLLLYAPNKTEMDRLMEEAGDAEGIRVFQLLGRGAKDAPIFAFGKGWKVREDAFGQYHAFAAEKLKEAVTSRSKKLATAHTESVKYEQEKLESAEDYAKVEDILFGNPKDVNGKATVIKWEHEGHRNAIVVRRQDKTLAVESVVGSAEKDFRDLQAMNKDHGLKGVLVMLFNIVDDRTGMLLAKLPETGKYRFSIRTPVAIAEEDARMWWNAALHLTLWIRTGCQSCVPAERIPDPVAAVAKPEKPAATQVVRQPIKPVEPQPLAVEDGDEMAELSVMDFHKTRRPGRYRLQMGQWTHKFTAPDGKLTGEEDTVKDLMLELQRFRGPDGHARILVNDFSQEHRDFLDKIGVLSPDGMPEHWLPPFVRNLLKTDFAMKKRAAAQTSAG